jgi:hypothetical protein
MAEETTRSDYLFSLKNPISGGSGLAPERAPIRDAAADGRSGAEKRRSPRYRCQGSAQIRELESGVSTWAAFTDISLHGCYVEAACTYPMGSTLSLSIEVNGFRVETRGEVRVNYPNLGMGIFFTTMSDGDRERLRELLRSLSRPSVILGTGNLNRSALPLPGSPSTTITDPKAAMQAILSFFADRQILSREEFTRILKRSQTP